MDNSLYDAPQSLMTLDAASKSESNLYAIKAGQQILGTATVLFYGAIYLIIYLYLIELIAFDPLPTPNRYLLLSQILATPFAIAAGVMLYRGNNVSIVLFFIAAIINIGVGFYFEQKQASALTQYPAFFSSMVLLIFGLLAALLRTRNKDS